MASGAQRRKRKKSRNAARKASAQQIGRRALRNARFVELVHAGMYTEPEAFEIITRLGSKGWLTSAQKRLVNEIVGISTAALVHAREL